jgi:lauroyl/myristoyl acyltransferase
MLMTPLLDDLRTAAKAGPWTQGDICRALGLSRPHVSQFLSGEKGLSVEAAEKLAAFLGLEIVARPMDNPRLDDMITALRERGGNRVIRKREAVQAILQALRRGETVGILIDQHIQAPDAVTVNFFDRPAATTLALGVLALRTGAPVIPAFTLPLPDGRYRLVYEHPVDPPRGDSPEAIRDFTQRCTDVLEMYVRRQPELWLWMHRRWRNDTITEGPGMFPAIGRENGNGPESDHEDA